ncbi:hypothetical protein CK203_063183 [Vitis vinifera]|uniref:Uncharacterized protein n=1 Tax=Vitis vinifera TaxID=29760 RepID=A0A438G4J3_VITVI|nr:hypothetical protein CK203_063183 [Vitis vinifera]
MQEYPDQVGGASKEKCGDIQMNKDIYRGGRSYAEVVAEDGFRTGGMSAGKWARAVICECQEKVQDWTHEGKAIARMMSMKGMVSINPISTFKGSAEIHFEEVGRVTKVAKETLKLVDLTKAKLWVEMLPNVVLPALLEVEDGAWTYTVAVSVTEKMTKMTLSRPRQPIAGTSG